MNGRSKIMPFPMPFLKKTFLLNCREASPLSDGSEHINLKVTGQDGSVVHFKIKRNTPLRKLMSAYCDRAGLKMGNVRFRFDGNPVNETDTPSQLEMEDSDSIDVFQQQTGGSIL